MFLDFYRKILLFHTISIICNLDAFFYVGFIAKIAVIMCNIVRFYCLIIPFNGYKN